MRWNRTPLQRGKVVEQPSERDVKNTFGLFRASLEDAWFYGGSVTRHALDAFDVRGDRNHVVVDVKVHMLMPKMSPAIPGWHTDGVLRVTDPLDRGTVNSDLGQPCMSLQEEYDVHEKRANRYHILVFGRSTTEFVADDNIEVTTPDGPDHDLYRILTRKVNDQVKRGHLSVTQLEPDTAYEFDWWRIHRAPIAQLREWRFLIRVTESDWYTPTTNKEDMIRKQSQVYMPMEYGW